MSQELAEQRSIPGACGLGGPLRYQNVVILWIQCDQDTLNHRLDARVDSMVAQGLLPEIRTFYESSVKPYGTCQYHRGILQTIGFKEFVKYLELYGQDQDREILEYLTAASASPGPKPTGLRLLEECLDHLKLVTRRYARRQLQWIRNRFLCDTGREIPLIYALDSSEIDHWKVQVSDPAVAIIDAVMSGQDSPILPVPKIELNRKRLEKERTFRCRQCERVFIGEYQWQIHIRSKKHRKMSKHTKFPNTDQQTVPTSPDVNIE
uniref:C2H2-type domain-containing protein n=1 Tax=Anopheles epiroticus TaxID=199890 RepID=A0A182PU44_9DIPT